MTTQSPEPPLTTRIATVADAARLTDLAVRTFTDTFAPQNTVRNMAAYLDATFAAELQAAELADPRSVVLFGEIDGVPAAYAHLRDADAPECVTGPAPIELARFYVDRPWHGRGVAQRLMDAVLQVAAGRGARTLWLGVWEQNHRAITFYARMGFREVGTQPFMLGDDVQTDHVMERAIGDD